MEPVDSDDEVLTATDHGVRLMTFNRPERLNAFTASGYDAFADTLRAAGRDPEVAVAVVTGAGRAFSSGARRDLLRGESNDDRADPGASFDRLLDALTAFPKPLLAAVNGPAVGFGMTMLLHFDLVLAADDARFQAPFTRLGLVPEAGSSYLLPRVMGRQQAIWLSLSGEWLDAQDAVDVGLVWRCCTSGRVVDETLAVARQLSAMPRPALLATKQLFAFGQRNAILAAHGREHEAMIGLADEGASS